MCETIFHVCVICQDDRFDQTSAWEYAYGRCDGGGRNQNSSDIEKVYLDKKEVSLTPKEYSLLECLMKHKNMVISREQLLVRCWGYDYEGESRAVNTHIKRLREKLGDHAKCIKTVIKAGYKLEV